MRILLDTHIALWAVVNDARLPAMARALLNDPDNSIFVSAATVWEIAIKFAVSRGRADAVPMSGGDALNDFLAARFEMLPILPSHAAAVDSLPLIHRDPFDRILLAQALAEPLKLLTSDQRMAEYGDTVILV
ncbi:MAG TPA: type II toxin-antitoxin system VapC family toxin [Rhizomicrobium sp.]|jgi:PIN domain nuclease of toxin-antitoxin system